ncbi:helix-turn-helix domain-containing protein [Pseudomonas sp. TAE6080]|uniref:helix-turn-helix domain-containing protein n=1 Tax=Pseudomonas sp. TAE6080 TaxID=2840374 RepID=UPI001C006796|nr:helix-turn-helix transcriptional regulator [Pseudomonas sp. TAE6080]MBT9300788.1 helix-turn-helix transcriptional regulator [Pseudomonas sp. TAE6080]
MSSLAVSTTVDQQIVLHQFTPRHSVQARALLGWSREDLARHAGVGIDAIQRFESHEEVDDAVRIALAFRLEHEGLVFFPGFAPGWGMSGRRSVAAQVDAAPGGRGLIARMLGSTSSNTPQPNGA